MNEQPHAEPVVWQWQEKATPEFGWAFCRNEEERFYLAQYPSKYNLRPLYIAPPRPDASGLDKEIEELKRENKVLRAITRGAQKADASAGLIEAAKIVKGRSMACSRDSEANLLDSLEKELRARAADRSGK